MTCGVMPEAWRLRLVKRRHQRSFTCFLSFTKPSLTETLSYKLLQLIYLTNRATTYNRDLPKDKKQTNDSQFRIFGT